MLYYNFKNYEEFKQLFGMQEHGNGVKSRRNKILLAWLKQPWVLKDAMRGYRRAIELSDMTQLWNFALSKVYETGEGCHRVFLLNMSFWNSHYRTDEMNGICEDGDSRSIRYVNVENDRVFKMKAGKFFHKLMDDSSFGRRLCEPVRRWMEEEFTQKWQTFAESSLPKYDLVVDNDFSSIYNREKCRGNFHSCMSFYPGQFDHSTFYRDAVKAKAASLRDKDGFIVARCIIFTEVRDDNTGEIVRLAERQYSTDCSDMLKRVLVESLIKAGEIDGYKRVGADCGSANSFVSNEGESWSDREFSIDISLEGGDVLSYQDSFKWFDDGTRAYNYESGYMDDELASTDDHYGGGSNYDSWHDEYVEEDVVTVYYEGREYTCSEDRLGEFTYVRGESAYYHNDEVVWSDYHDEYLVRDDSYYSDLTDDYYLDEYTKDRAEEDWHYDHGESFSEWDDEWFDKDEVVTMRCASGYTQTITIDAMNATYKVEFNEEVGVYVEVLPAE